MVAFIFTTLIGIGGVVGALWYGRRRPVGSPLSWGEAMAAAVFAFFMFFWWYAVIPHQWLSWAAEPSMGWTTTKLLLEPTDIQPLTVSFQVLRDIVAVMIYGIGLGLQLFVWAVWQERGKERPTIVPTSRYGRPLVRRG